MKTNIVKKIGSTVLLAAIWALGLSAFWNASGAGFKLEEKEEGVIIASLPSSSSPSLAQSRVNAMVGLAGGSVPTDRSVDAAAWHVIPSDDIEWYDAITTSFSSWMGASNSAGKFAGEKGHRLVTHLSGKFPVSKYWARVTSNNPNLTGGFFQVGMDTATGKEIPFNQNFVGINFGANGKLDSTINPATGIWEAKVDDTVYANGQLPSAVTYDVWYRFGSTTSATVTDTGGFEKFKMDSKVFADLIVRDPTTLKDTVVATRVVTIAPPRLLISRDENIVRINITDGRPMAAYEIWTSNTVIGPWMAINTATSGQGINQLVSDAPRFYRLKAK